MDDSYNILEEYHDTISSIDYLPRYFLDINTDNFGLSLIKDEEIHPFLQLKQKGLSSEVSIEDRMQCVRYMISIPYKENIKHAIEVIKCIQDSKDCDIYELYNFWNTQDPYYKLDDMIIYDMHPYIFKQSKKIYLPLDLVLTTCKYILSNYGREHEIRQDVLDYMLDIVCNPMCSEREIVDVSDILIKTGELDEVMFGKQLKSKHELKENNEINVINKLRYLRITYSLKPDDFEDVMNTIKSFFKEYVLFKYINLSTTLDYKQYLEYGQYLNNLEELVTNENYRFENCSYKVILYLIYLYNVKNNESMDIFLESIYLYNKDDKQFIIYLLDSCQCPEMNLNLRVNLKTELRTVIFKKYNHILYGLTTIQKNSVLESIKSEDDKMDVEQFLDYYSLEDDIYKQYKEELNREDYNKYYEDIIREYSGKKI